MLCANRKQELALDHKQNLDTTNTMTQRGTKIQQSKLNCKIVGHKEVVGQRKYFCGAFFWTMGNENKMNLKGTR